MFVLKYLLGCNLMYPQTHTIKITTLFQFRTVTEMRTVTKACDAGKDLDLITMFQVVKGWLLNTLTIATTPNLL